MVLWSIGFIANRYRIPHPISQWPLLNQRCWFWTLKFVSPFVLYVLHYTVQPEYNASDFQESVSIIRDKIAFAVLRSLKKFLLCESDLTLQGVTKSFKHGNHHEHTLIKRLLNCIEWRLRHAQWWKDRSNKAASKTSRLSWFKTTDWNSLVGRTQPWRVRKQYRGGKLLDCID